MGRARKRPLLITLTVVILGGGVAIAPTAVANYRRPWNERRDLTSMEFPALDGKGNNRRNPDWGRAGTPYSRVTPATYEDGRRHSPTPGPTPGYVSNRIFNDTHQNLFSENAVTQWGFVWGQFLDHTFGLRDEAGAAANMPFDADRPAGVLHQHPGRRSRSPGRPPSAGTGAGDQPAPADQHGQLLHRRLGGLRRHRRTPGVAARGAGRRQPAQQRRHSCCCPTACCRGGTAAATPPPRPTMATDGRLLASPAGRAVAGDVRANENIALTATHTLFAREHNRIVSHAAELADQRAEVPDRPADRHRGAAVHHLQRVPAGARRAPLPRTAATTRASTRR